ncbi:MAG: formylglycine-generating enzyme family protein [Symploca sp. SIO2E9]|nr:formylglycine-generating enzyme family protein [Symploca sp. SIO2E9]
MAATPVSLPVIDLLRDEFLPEAQQAHVAEVLLSGLLRRCDTDNDQKCHYEFFGDGSPEPSDRVRYLLLDGLPEDKAVSVLDRLSQIITQKAGRSLNSFEAFLANLQESEYDFGEAVLPFARVGLDTLLRIGGDYAAIARRYSLEQLLPSTPNGETKTTQEVPGSEELTLEGFPPLKNFEFKIATIPTEDETETPPDINLQPFDFEVALIEVNQSVLSSADNPIDILDEEFLSKTRENLNDLQQLILKGAFTNQTYEQIATSAGNVVKQLPVGIRPHLSKYLRNNVAPNLWKVLSEVLGKKITKKNVKKVIEEWVAYRHLTIRRVQRENHYFTQDLGKGIGLEMVQIPRGTFTMGAPKEEEDSRSSERPQHQVKVLSFFMGKYPITQEQWKAVAALDRINRDLELEPSNFKGDNRPVEMVSWYDAVEFCSRLSEYTNRSYRLPSEAEWEYACRAGTTTPFHFGETITSELANYNAEYIYGAGVKGYSANETTAVGSFSVANAFGLYDMHGNVWEWCQDDWHESYEGAPTDGSAWLDKNENLSQKTSRAVLRGGSWFSAPKYCRSVYRNWDDRAERGLIDGDVGVRVVCGLGRTLE